MWGLFAFLFAAIHDLIKWFLGKAISIGIRYPILLAYIAAVFILSSAFYLSISGFLLALNLVFPNQYLTLVSSFIPSNLHACFSIVLSVRFILLTYNWAFRFKDKMYQLSSDSSKVS